MKISLLSRPSSNFFHSHGRRKCLLHLRIYPINCAYKHNLFLVIKHQRLCRFRTGRVHDFSLSEISTLGLPCVSIYKYNTPGLQLDLVSTARQHMLFNSLLVACRFMYRDFSTIRFATLKNVQRRWCGHLPSKEFCKWLIVSNGKILSNQNLCASLNS